MWALRHRRPLTALISAILVVSGLLSPWLLPPHLLVVTALVVALVVSAQGSHGQSMAPSLKPWTRGILLGTPPFPIRRDDVVLAIPEGLRPVCKRVAGLPGDRLRFAEGGVFRAERDGWVPLRLSFDAEQHDPRAQRELVVPEGCVWLLGDHVSSVDSRAFGAVPRAAVIGRYLPVWQAGASGPEPLSTEDRLELEALRAVAPRSLARVERVVSVGHCGGHCLSLALHFAWLEADRPDRAMEVAERAWRTAADPVARGLWTHLLAGDSATDPERCLAGVRRHLEVHPDTPFTTALRVWEATMLARTGRWDEALAAADVAGPDQLVAVRISALLGLGRIDEAEAVVDRAAAASSWADPSHGPYYRGLVAAARGDHDAAADALVAALARGFTDPDLLETTPHLAVLRRSPAWRRVSDALRDPPREVGHVG